MSFVLDAMERFEEPPLEDDLADRLTQLGEWLLHMVSNDQGHVPVTGANDGAMFETLHHQDYRDYRPSLQLYFALLRSEEHTSELQSRGHLVCRLLLAKKT